jgi:hypothetical protein
VGDQEPASALNEAVRGAGPRPEDDAGREAKKNYAERLSNRVALAIAARLRELGLAGCQPDAAGGRERQFAGGIGAKKVDVSHATEEDGLILAVSVKSISFADRRTRNYQKNLTNRRGDLLAEATTLHQRFPYAVIGGLFLFDERAERDGTGRRPSTVMTAHEYFRAFDRRHSQSNAVEKFEALGILLCRAADPIACRYFDAGDPETERPLDAFLRRLLERIAERNPDRFRFAEGRVISRRLPPVPTRSDQAEDSEGDE